MSSAVHFTLLHLFVLLVSGARDLSQVRIASTKATALSKGRVNDTSGSSLEEGVRNVTALSTVSVSSVGSAKSSVAPIILAMIGAIPEFLHHLDEIALDAVADSELQKWKKVDSQWWGSKYVCFVHMQMLLWTMSRSPAVAENDVCEATGSSASLRDLLHRFSRRAKMIADRLWLSKKSEQSPIEYHSAQLIVEARTVLTVIAQILECFLSSAHGADRGLVARTMEASRVIGEYTEKRMDYVGIALASSTAAAQAGPCTGTDSKSWAVGSWRVVCTTEQACALLGVVSGSVYSVSDVSTYAWLGGAAGWSYVMRLADADAPFTKHSGYWTSSAPTWRLQCVAGVASKISLDNGKTWFTWSGEQYVYVAEFSDATDPEWRFTSTFLNAYIEKVTWGNSIRIATSTQQVS